MMARAGQAVEALMYMTLGASVGYVALVVAKEYAETKRNGSKS